MFVLKSFELVFQHGFYLLMFTFCIVEQLRYGALGKVEIKHFEAHIINDTRKLCC